MPSEPPQDLALLLSRAEHRMAQRLASLLAEEGSTIEQWRVLSLIADGQGHPMTEIADHALMPPPSLTKLVDRMVAANLVHRRPDPADRRRVLLHLTDRGRVTHQRSAHRVLDDQTRLLAAIDDHGDLARALAHLTTAFSSHPAQTAPADH